MSTSDPRENGYDGEIEEGLPQFIGWFGHCPECGGYLITKGGNYADECQYDECEECGWTSDLDC